MITVTYRQYCFPISEKYKEWFIIYERITTSQGLTKLKGTIKPDFRTILETLLSNGELSNIDIDLHRGYVFTEKGKRYCDALEKFCNTYYNIVIKKWAYSLGNALDGGDDSCSNKAMKKIKKELDNEYPFNLTREFISYLNR